MVQNGFSIKRVLVTGGNGFIGSRLAARLPAQGYETICLLRRSADRTRLRGLDIRALLGSLEDSASLERAVQGADAICHLAGSTRGPDYWGVNARGTANLVRAVARSNPGLKKFVYLSSISAQGPGRMGRLLTEADQANPISAYGRSKLAGERALSGLPAQTRVLILRAPIVYGPGDDSPLPLVRAVRKGILPRVSPPDTLYSLIQVEDLVRAVVSGLEIPGAQGVFLVSDGRACSLDDMAHTLALVMGVGYRTLNIPRPVLGTASLIAEGWSLLTGKRGYLGWDKFLDLGGRSWAVDRSRAVRELGLPPGLDLESGLADLVDWYVSTGRLKPVQQPISSR